MTNTNTNAGKNVVCFAFTVGQRVRIKEIDKTGTVYSLIVSVNGIEYSVKYFNDSETRCFEWFMPSDLEAL